MKLLLEIEGERRAQSFGIQRKKGGRLTCSTGKGVNLRRGEWFSRVKPEWEDQIIFMEGREKSSFPERKARKKCFAVLKGGLEKKS